MRPRILAIVLPLFAACRAEEKPPTNDSADVAAFRTQADSIAKEMAQAITSLGTRTGTWKANGDSSEWTARMQGEHVSVLEERIVFADSGSAVRGYFFSSTGALEQISERRMIRRGGATQSSEVQIDFTEAGARGRRVIGGSTTDVSANDIHSLRQHAAQLLAAVRAAAPDTTGPR